MAQILDDAENKPNAHFATIRLHTLLAQENYRPSLIVGALKDGADSCAPSQEGVPPLSLATRKRWAEAIVALLDHGADSRAVDSGGQTALMVAVNIVWPNGVRLLAPVSDPGQKDAQGRTAIKMALDQQTKSHDDRAAQGQLLEHLAKAFGSRGLAALNRQEIEKLAGIAIWQDTADLLLACAAKIKLSELPDFEGMGFAQGLWPPVAIAAGGRQNGAVLKLLLADGADASRRGPNGETALMRAAGSGAGVDGSDLECIRVLLPLSDIDARDDGGETALMRAQSEGAATALLAARADPNLKNKEGDTALLLAIKSIADCKGPSAGRYMTALRKLVILAPVSDFSIASAEGLSVVDWAIMNVEKTGDWRPLEVLVSQMSPKGALAASLSAVARANAGMDKFVERARACGLTGEDDFSLKDPSALALRKRPGAPMPAPTAPRGVGGVESDAESFIEAKADPAESVSSGAAAEVAEHSLSKRRDIFSGAIENDRDREPGIEWNHDWSTVDKGIKKCVNEWVSWGPLKALMGKMPIEDAFEVALRVAHCAMPAVKPLLEARLLEIEVERVETTKAVKSQKLKSDFVQGSVSTDRDSARLSKKKKARL